MDPVAIDVFAHYYRLVESGETGMVPEDTIDPLDMERARRRRGPRRRRARGARPRTVVIKLNGGLGTSMGMDRAKSLLEVRDGLTFLDVIARQVLALRERYDARLPLLFMNSFRTREDTLAALAPYDDLAVDGLPLDFLQNKEPKLRADDLTPVDVAGRPDARVVPARARRPLHGAARHRAAGPLLDAGYTQAFVSNSDNLGAVPDPRVAGWFAASGAPFAIEAVRRTASDRKGGHLARRKSDGRIVLRETAQTLARGPGGARPTSSGTAFCLDQQPLVRPARDAGRAGRARRRARAVDDQQRQDRRPRRLRQPRGDPDRDRDGRGDRGVRGAATIEVGRDRFVPVKTTNDLLVLRSDCYGLDDESVLHQVPSRIPFVDLDTRLQAGRAVRGAVPRRAAEPGGRHLFVVRGDWTFGPDVRAGWRRSFELGSAHWWLGGVGPLP